MIKESPNGKKFIGRCYKRSFPSKREAKKIIKKSKQNTKMKNVYKCNQCESWHLTHLSEKDYLQKVADFKLITFLRKDLNC